MDKMEITILDDGTIKVETDAVTPTNHMTAEAFLRHIATAAGGTQERRHQHGILRAAIHAVQHTLGSGHTH